MPREVLASARGLALRGGGSGKVEGGTASAPLPRPLDRLFPPGSPEASKIASLGDAVLEKLIGAVENQEASRKLNLIESEVIRSV